mgnify:FL=1|jgi:predicted transglutaminase-like protease|tara:strand:+ start:75 stop:323 length:249 start_codon:yes stop_codon:yes gene_type:complete
MAKANENSIVIDDKEYKESELSDKQKYFANQVQDLRSKKSRIQFELDQIMASLDVFNRALLDSFKEQSEEVLEKSEKPEGGE